MPQPQGEVCVGRLRPGNGEGEEKAHLVQRTSSCSVYCNDLSEHYWESWDFCGSALG